MTIPSESDLLNDLNLLATYENLRKDGSFSRLLPLVAMLRQIEAVSVGGTVRDELLTLEAIKTAIGSKTDPVASKYDLYPDGEGNPGAPFSEISLLKASLKGLADILDILATTSLGPSTPNAITELTDIVRYLGNNSEVGLYTNSNVTYINSDTDSAQITRPPISISGKAVTAETYAPNYIEGHAATLPIDKDSGALLTYGRKLTTTDDAVINQPKSYATAVVNQIPSDIVETILLNPNTSRRWGSIDNASSSTLFIKLGTGVSIENYSIKIAPNSYKELTMPYSGVITGVWDIINGTAHVTQITG